MNLRTELDRFLSTAEQAGVDVETLAVLRRASESILWDPDATQPSTPTAKSGARWRAVTEVDDVDWSKDRRRAK